jgi:hypothetical protein
MMGDVVVGADFDCDCGLGMVWGHSEEGGQCQDSLDAERSVGRSVGRVREARERGGVREEEGETTLT